MRAGACRLPGGLGRGAHRGPPADPAAGRPGGAPTQAADRAVTASRWKAPPRPALLAQRADSPRRRGGCAGGSRPARRRRDVLRAPGGVAALIDAGAARVRALARRGTAGSASAALGVAAALPGAGCCWRSWPRRHRRRASGFVTDSTVLRILAVLLVSSGSARRPCSPMPGGSAGRRRCRAGLARSSPWPQRSPCCWSTSGPLAGARRAWAGAGLLDEVFHGRRGAGGRRRSLHGAAARRRRRARPRGHPARQRHAGQHRRRDRADGALQPAAQPRGRAVRSRLARRAAMPQGWSCGDACLLNAIYTWGDRSTQPVPRGPRPGRGGDEGGGLGRHRPAGELLRAHRPRRVPPAVDAIGGITVTVARPVPIGGGTSKVKGYIRPGTQHLDGYHALWFARSRHGASDYARMQRQRCVMNAMLHQLDPAGVLSHFEAIAAASGKVVSTDLPGERARHVRGPGGRRPAASR